jgi:hypothetical protein
VDVLIAVSRIGADVGPTTVIAASHKSNTEHPLAKGYSDARLARLTAARRRILQPQPPMLLRSRGFSPRAAPRPPP